MFAFIHIASRYRQTDNDPALPGGACNRAPFGRSACVQPGQQTRQTAALCSSKDLIMENC